MKLNLVIIIILSSFCLYLKTFAAEQDNDTINLAAFYNLTGPQSTLDIFSANGAKLAEESINKSGGVLGKKLNIIFYDGKSNVNLMKKFVQDVSKNKNINMSFGINDSNLAINVLPSLIKAKKLFITSGSTSPNLINLFPKNIFLACFSDDKQGEAVAQFSFYNLHAKKILLLEQKNLEYAKTLSKFYNNAWNNLNEDKNSLKKTLFSKDISDQKEIIFSIHNLNPDVVFIAAAPDVVIHVANFLRSMNYHNPILGGDTFDSKEIETVKGGDIYYTTHSFVSNENPDPIVQIFIKQYEEKFSQEPDSSFAALGFDTVYLLVHAITLAQSTDPIKVSEALHKIRNYHLITGNITFLENTNIPEKSLTIIRVQEGKKSVMLKK